MRTQASRQAKSIFVFVRSFFKLFDFFFKFWLSTPFSLFVNARTERKKRGERNTARHFIYQCRVCVFALLLHLFFRAAAKRSKFG